MQRYTFVGNYTTFSVILAVFVDYFKEKEIEIQFFCITLQTLGKGNEAEHLQRFFGEQAAGPGNKRLENRQNQTPLNKNTEV